MSKPVDNNAVVPPEADKGATKSSDPASPAPETVARADDFEDFTLDDIEVIESKVFA